MKAIAIALGILFFTLAAFAQTPAQAPAIRKIDVEYQRRCRTVITTQLGNPDNFAPGPDPVSPSPALTAFLSSHSSTAHPSVPYDGATNCDHLFGDSFRNDGCLYCGTICAVELEITMKGCGSGLDCNDSITVGQAPFNTGGGVVLWSGPVDPNGCNSAGGGSVGPGAIEAGTTNQAKRVAAPATIVKKIPLDVNRFKALMCEKKAQFLDVMVQDDQIIDSMRLIVTKP